MKGSRSCGGVGERFWRFTLETTTDTAPSAGSAGSHNEYWRERWGAAASRLARRGPPDGRHPPLTPAARGCDPASYAAPWTAAVTMTTRQGPVFEYACHEGNDGAPGLADSC